MKTYTNYLFDLDDTLLNFRASESLSFQTALSDLRLDEDKWDKIFPIYQEINRKLWLDFEKGLISKDFLCVERFRLLFEKYQIDFDPNLAGKRFVDALPESVVLIDGAVEVLEWLSSKGEIGIITNGVERVQQRRIQNSPLKDFISYICVSERCGYAKPDVRFFEYAAKHARNFSKESTLVVGDRYDADVLGAHLFGVDCVWFNHHNEKRDEQWETYEITSLADLTKIVL